MYCLLKIGAFTCPIRRLFILSLSRYLAYIRFIGFFFVKPVRAQKITKITYCSLTWVSGLYNELNCVTCVDLTGSITKQLNFDQLVTSLATFLLNLMSGNPFDWTNLNILFRTTFKGDSMFLPCHKNRPLNRTNYDSDGKFQYSL